jgi:hypothetical protein
MYDAHTSSQSPDQLQDQRIQDLKKFVEVRNALFEFLKIKKYRKERYRIVNEIRKIVREKPKIDRLKIRFMGVEIPLLDVQKQQKLKQMIEDYVYWRSRATEIIYKMLVENYVFYDLSNRFPVHVSEVYEAFHDCALKILDKIEVTNCMLFYVKKWIQTELSRKLEKQRRVQVIPFSSLLPEDEKGNEDGWFRVMYHHVDELEDVFIDYDTDSILDGLYEERSDDECERECEDSCQDASISKLIFSGKILSSLKKKK